MIATLDANVFVAALKPDEPHHAACAQLLIELAARRNLLECPNLVIVEVAATIARRTRNPVLSRAFLQQVQATPFLRLRPLDPNLAEATAQIALTHFLRGADSVYVAVAREVGATLITLDQEMRQRGAAAVATMTPAEWLQSIGVTPPPP